MRRKTHSLNRRYSIPQFPHSSYRDRGEVFSFGWNYTGQLGTGDTSDRLEPTSIKSLALIKALKNKRFVQVCAGSEHSIVLSGIFLLWEPSHDPRYG